MANNKKRLYVAYGSNLHLGQMEYRCPTARIYGYGVLKGWRLLFKGSYGNAYCTIAPDANSEVPVLIWDIKPQDEERLDLYEGYPNFYYKRDVEVELETGETVTAMVYIMTDEIPSRIHLNLPSNRYWNTVLTGYKQAGFDPVYLDEAYDISQRAVIERFKRTRGY